MNIILTGSSGFIGSKLHSDLLNSYNNVYTLSGKSNLITTKPLFWQELKNNRGFSHNLFLSSVVVHLAARNHITKDIALDPLSEYRKINVVGTLNLARQAAINGARRFIYISTIKVNGEKTSLGHPFTADDAPAPEDAYGISKWEAEQGLNQLAAKTNMEVVIIRPPLVYGPNVKGNFSSMIKLVGKELPLPLGSIHNKRSLVALDNLVDLIITCIDHPAAANQVFLAGDGHDLSTTELLQSVAKAMSKKSRLLPVPSSLLMFGATLLGKKAVAQRLLGSLQVDISKTRELLGWEPPISVEEGLKRCFVKNS